MWQRRRRCVVQAHRRQPFQRRPRIHRQLIPRSGPRTAAAMCATAGREFRWCWPAPGADSRPTPPEWLRRRSMWRSPARKKRGRSLPSCSQRRRVRAHLVKRSATAPRCPPPAGVEATRRPAPLNRSQTARRRDRTQRGSRVHPASNTASRCAHHGRQPKYGPHASRRQLRRFRRERPVAGVPPQSNGRRATIAVR
jgi:hypothetical protein